MQAAGYISSHFKNDLLYTSNLQYRFYRLLITSCCYNKRALDNLSVYWCVPDATFNARKQR